MRRRAQPWLGTLVEISIADKIGENACRDAYTAAFGAIADIHALMSFHAPSSDVSRINRSRTGALTRVSQATYAVLAMAERIWRDSRGLFNIACAPELVKRGFLPRPETEAVQYRPGAPTLALEPDCMVRKLGPAWVDLGGIAKGYAVDSAITALRQAGVTAACVNAGGDLKAFGDANFGVALRMPEMDGRLIDLPDFRDASIATSALYYTERDPAMRGNSHLIDGQTGDAVNTSASVSVIAPDCIVADALTKVVLASGRADHPILRQHRAIAFMISGPRSVND